MRVLSLFDGISCARVALDRAGIPVTEYLASEIDPHAIAISTKNYPDIIRLGDVREVRMSHLKGPIDLLIGGSPCQDLSIAKKNRKGLEGDRSGLFWEYVRIWQEVRPTWFVLENVASMPKADREVITKTLGVEPVLLDAALVSAQSRKRLFWTNLPVGQPEDRGILLRDILEAEVDASYDVRGGQWEYEQNKARKQRTMVFTSTPEKAENGRKKQSFVQVGFFGSENASGVGGQALRVYDAEGKSTTSGVGFYKVGRDVGRRLNAEGHREDDNRALPYQRRIELREDNKTGTLTSVLKDNLVVADTRIRKLTPVECERLQGLPDGYTEGVAKTHRYKALGNAFPVEVVAHILRSLAGGRGV